MTYRVAWTRHGITKVRVFTDKVACEVFINTLKADPSVETIHYKPY